MNDLKHITEITAAELAFAKIFNVYPGVFQNKFTEVKGMGRVDVRYSHDPDSALIVPVKKNEWTDEDSDPDAHALLINSGDSYRFAGWIPHDELFTENNLMDSESVGPAYALEQSELQERPPGSGNRWS